MILGTPVYEESSPEPLGTLSGIVIHPDTGAVEVFWVHIRNFLENRHLLLLPMDILHWGNRIFIRTADVLAEAEDVLRLQPLLDQQRPVLGQMIRTVSGKMIGRCGDVQFDSRHFRVEWLFPKKLFRWSAPIPVTQIQEITTEAIIVKEEIVPVEETPESIIPQVPEVA